MLSLRSWLCEPYSSIKVFFHWWRLQLSIASGQTRYNLVSFWVHSHNRLRVAAKSFQPFLGRNV